MFLPPFLSLFRKKTLSSLFLAKKGLRKVMKTILCVHYMHHTPMNTLESLFYEKIHAPNFFRKKVCATIFTLKSLSPPYFFFWKKSSPPFFSWNKVSGSLFFSKKKLRDQSIFTKYLGWVLGKICLKKSLPPMFSRKKSSPSYFFWI